MAGRGQIRVGRRGHVQHARRRREREAIDALVLVERVGHGRQPDPRHFADACGIRRLHAERLAVADAGGRARDRRPRAGEQVGRREHFDLRMAVAARTHDTTVGEQQRGGVVEATDALARERREALRRGIPQLRDVHRTAHVVEAAAACSTGDEDCAVR